MKSSQMSKPSMPGPSSSTKYRKNSKDREKRKSQTEANNHSSNDKGSPTKESSSRSYAGIGSDSICVYAEQTTFEHLSEEVCDLLSEDINYRIRYIIQDSLLKARLCGRNSIVGTDVEESFANLKIDKVYGAPSNPNWVPFGDQNLYYLDDTKVNLIELSRKDTTYVQAGDPLVTRKWFPEQKEVNKTLKKYFTSMCAAIVDKDDELRTFALKDISENPHAGPIMEWFYRFGYFLLTKDITYDCLTLYALDLIDTLENSILGRTNVSEKQLKLLVRLLLQRLLRSVTAPEVLRQMCAVLALLCERSPLRELVFAKVQQKTPQVCVDCPLPVLTVVNCLGADAVRRIFVPHMSYFLDRIAETQEPDLTYALLGTYNIVCLSHMEDVSVHNAFREVFGELLFMYWRYPKFEADTAQEWMEPNRMNAKKALIKTRRKFDWQRPPRRRYRIEEVFETHHWSNKLRNNVSQHVQPLGVCMRERWATVGQTSLLLRELRDKREKTHCRGHTMIAYTL